MSETGACKDNSNGLSPDWTVVATGSSVCFFQASGEARRGGVEGGGGCCVNGAFVNRAGDGGGTRNSV